MPKQSKDVSTENETRERVKNRIADMGILWDDLSDKDINYLIKAENAIMDIEKDYKEYRSKINRLDVNPKSVSERMEITRATVYNNQILKDYISYASNFFIKEDDIRNEEVTRLKNELNLMHLRDVKYLEMERDVEKLKSKIKSLESLLTEKMS